MARTLVRYQRRLIQCEVGVASTSGERDGCRAAAVATAVADEPAARTCRTCFRFADEVTRLRDLDAGGAALIRCEPPDGSSNPRRCRSPAGHALASFVGDATRCHLDAARRTHALDAPACIQEAEARYAARLAARRDTCPPCAAVPLAVLARNVTRQLLDRLFCSS